MNRIQRLLQSYQQFVSLPWRSDTAAAQRVIFCVYDPIDERRLLALLGEFELASRTAGHAWRVVDLTDTFPRWFATHKYATKYFQKPDLLPPLMPRYLDTIESEFKQAIADIDDPPSAVVALSGVASLFGLMKVRDVVDRLAPLVAGRLLVFFPGSFADNNYRLLDGYDGWNYLAVPITSDGHH